MSGIDEQESTTRVLMIDYCLLCPYCIFDEMTEDYLCQLSDMEVIDIDVETDIMDGCKLSLLKDMKK